MTTPGPVFPSSAFSSSRFQEQALVARVVGSQFPGTHRALIPRITVIGSAVALLSAAQGPVQAVGISPHSLFTGFVWDWLGWGLLGSLGFWAMAYTPKPRGLAQRQKQFREQYYAAIAAGWTQK